MINSKNYVDKAEAVINELRKPDERGKTQILTTSQIRKQLAMTAELSTLAEKETNDTLNDELQSRIEYLRVQFVYQAGREPQVKSFVEKAKILEILKDINGNREKFLVFCKYMEALVAYRKFYVKEDK
ncbi:MAG: type III-A CRISPR-associated protein Csm2 [Oscillospiraceae bacterium]|nr:type III-A CRISPR-associated protein Csm2 [Oscillospiraceae bacterium]